MKFTLFLLHNLFLAGNCLIAVFEETVRQYDLIKSCVESEFKMVWGLFIRRKVQQNLFLLPSVISLLSHIELKFLEEAGNVEETYWQRRHLCGKVSFINCNSHDFTC